MPAHLLLYFSFGLQDFRIGVAPDRVQVDQQRAVDGLKLRLGNLFISLRAVKNHLITGLHALDTTDSNLTLPITGARWPWISTEALLEKALR